MQKSHFPLSNRQQIQTPINESGRLISPQYKITQYLNDQQFSQVTEVRKNDGKRLWKIARQKVKVIARINAMKRITLQNYYGVREGNELEQIDSINYWVLLPDSKFKSFWESIVIILMIYTATILPFRLSFFDDNDSDWKLFDDLTNYFFMVDILINFFSAYYDQDNVLVTNNLYIAKHYLKGWFIIDVLSVLPITDLITQFSTSQDSTDQTDDQTAGQNADNNNNNNANQNKGKQFSTLVRLARLPRLYKLVRVLRLLKLAKLKEGGKQSFIAKLLRPLFKMDASIKRMIKIMALSLLFLHLSACFYYMITKIEDAQINWVTNLGIEDADTATLYIRALHWSLQTLATVGFGDVPPQTNWEKLYVILWMGVGSAFFSFMISNLQGTVNDQDNSVKTKVMRLEVLQKDYHMPDQLFKQIKRHIESQSLEQNRAHIIQQTKPLLKQLPTCLRSSVLLCIYAHVIEKIKFLQDKDIELIMAVIPKISALNWAQHDILYSAEDYAEEVYFISVGEITTRAADGSAITVYKDGDAVGLLEVIYDIRRIGTAICSKNTQLYSLDRTTYLQMLWAYPQLLSEVKQQVDKRIIEVKPFVEDSSILNRSIYEVVQDYKRKITKIERVIEQLQKSEQQEMFEIDNSGSSVQGFLQKYDSLSELFHIPEKDLNSSERISFESQRQMNQIVDQLADLWQKQLIENIDTMHKQTGKVVKQVQDRVEYYQIANKKVYLLKIYIQKFASLKMQFQKAKSKLSKVLE